MKSKQPVSEQRTPLQEVNNNCMQIACLCTTVCISSVTLLVLAHMISLNVEE